MKVFLGRRDPLPLLEEQNSMGSASQDLGSRLFTHNFVLFSSTFFFFSSGEWVTTRILGVRVTLER